MEERKLPTFTDDSPFTFDHTNEDNFRRHVRKPNNSESLRPEFHGSSHVLPGNAPHKGSQKGDFRMIPDPCFLPTRGILLFFRKVKP